MKTKAFLRVVRYMCIFAVVLCLSVGCTEEVVPTPSPKPNTEVAGEVEFTVETPEGSGMGTNSSPIVVSSSDTLSLSISQKSSYTDPNGSILTVEPEAVVGLYAQADTVTAEDLQTLVRVKEFPEVVYSSEGDNPRRELAKQTFEVGGQEIVFNLSHEIYQVTNSLNEEIELPYIKLNEANFGSANSEETGSTRAAVSAISVRQLGVLTRSGTVTDSTMYEVTVRFNLELEGVNVKKETKQTLVFSVSYIGVVEKVTELQDPEYGLSYEWARAGQQISSPFAYTVSKGNSLTLDLVQTATYKNMFGADTICSPKAQVVLSAVVDTVWAANKEAFEEATGDVVAKETSSEGNPTLNRGQYVFDIGGQTVTFELNYESNYVLTDAMTGEPVTMAYVQLGVPVLDHVQVTELSNASLPGKEAKLYKVAAHFSVDVASVGVSEPKVETVQFVVNYIGAVEIKLVKVTYKRDWLWIEPHDNITLVYHAMVHRTRHYSTGESFTDTFMDYWHIPAISLVCWYEPADFLKDKVQVDLLSYNEGSVGDSIWTKVYKTAIYASDIKSKPEVNEWLVCTDTVGIWRNYVNNNHDYGAQSMALADDVEIDGDIGEPIPEYLKDRRPDWYSAVTSLVKQNTVFFTEDYGIAIEARDARDDQYLLLDGRMFTFIDKKLRPDPVFTSSCEKVSGGWASKIELKMQYLGRNFKATVIDTMLVNPK